jgi:uncharacterized protein (DUF4415 family)
LSAEGFVKTICSYVRFEWDSAKNAGNVAKHGISFADMAGIFDGPVLERIDLRRDYGEARISALGWTSQALIYVVIPCETASAASSRREELIDMRERHTISPIGNRTKPLKTDWTRVKAMTDEEIEENAKADPDAAPTDLEFWKGAKLVYPEAKQPITLRIDREVLAWFKAKGPRYQSRMNAVLKAYVEAHRKAD